MKMVGLKQSHQIMGGLGENTDWGRIPSDVGQDVIDDPVGSGRAFTDFLLARAKFPPSSSILHIDRSAPFNPVKFLGEGWSIWRGPADGDGLSGNEDQDQRSLALTELDLSKVQLVTTLRGRETRIGGEEKLLRLKESGSVRLDAKVFLTLWENKDRIPEIWKEKTGGSTTYVFFDGTILRGPDGGRYVLYVCWGGGEWGWGYRWLGFGWYSYNPSAVLAS